MTGIFTSDALAILELDDSKIYDIICDTNKLRERRHGRAVSLCWIVNAKSGACDQDCAFCSQSSRSEAAIDTYGMIDPERILENACRAADAGATKFSIVTSGGAVERGPDLDKIIRAVNMNLDETGLEVCASLGCISFQVLEDLRRAGVTRYHHNMETAQSFWPNICTTREYEESRRVIRDAKQLNMEVCSGGIFGLGESLAQRAELLEEIRNLKVNSVAINFLSPIPGTPLEDLKELTPLDCIRIIAATRMMMPKHELRICGGRDQNLRELQPMLFAAGASGIMIGDYLTTKGRNFTKDLTLIADMGLLPETIPRNRITVTADDPIKE